MVFELADTDGGHVKAKYRWPILIWLCVDDGVGIQTRASKEL
jgi:hypothetical protein